MPTAVNLPTRRGSGKLLNLSLLAVFLICSLQVFPMVGHDPIVPQTWEITSSSVFRRAVEIAETSSSDLGTSNIESNPPSSSNSSTGDSNSDSNGNDNPDDLVVDPLTPAGTVKFKFPFPYVKPADITIFPINEVMTIKWEWNNVVIMPRIITIQINSPGVTAKVKGSTVQTADDRWFPVAVNISANRDQYQWLANVTDRAGYQFRIFDSEVGPVYAGKPGRLALSTSSKFNLYIAGQDPSYLEMYSSRVDTAWSSQASLIQTGIVLTAVVLLSHWL